MNAVSADNSSYKMNNFWACNEQHGHHSCYTSKFLREKEDLKSSHNKNKDNCELMNLLSTNCFTCSNHFPVSNHDVVRVKFTQYMSVTSERTGKKKSISCYQKCIYYFHSIIYIKIHVVTLVFYMRKILIINKW